MVDYHFTGNPPIRITRWIPHKPTIPQHAFLWLNHMEALYGGALGGGKSDSILMAAAQYVDIPGYSALLLRRTYPELSMPGGLMQRSLAWWTNSDAKWNGDEKTWTFPSGAKIVFGHCETERHVYRYYGSEWQYIGWDELTTFPEAWYRLLFSRVRKPAEGLISQVPLRVRGATNPGGPHGEWVKRRFIDKLTDPDDLEDTQEKARQRMFVPAKLQDNPYIDQEAYLQSVSHLEPETRRQLVEGDWDARPSGKWYFDDKQVAAVKKLGREYRELLLKGQMPPPAGDVLPLGIDWGESTHGLLGWPLEGGGLFVVREFVGVAGEPSESTVQILDMNTFGWPLGRARYDAAGIQSMRTFKKVSQGIMGSQAPRPSKISFGSQTGRAANQKRSYKGEACQYLRRLARRASEGHLVQILAVSPDCTELLRQMKKLPRDPENTSGAWLKEEDQHGPDALVAVVAPIARRHREAGEGKKPSEEKELV